MNEEIIKELGDKLFHFCNENECILVCKPRERVFKQDCVINKFIEYLMKDNEDNKNNK